MSKNRYTAFIPVRVGSKSIKLKNIRPIAGKPLVYWTIEAACRCKALESVYVSTDGEIIRACVEELLEGFSHPEKIRFADRDPATATDQASTESAMLDFAAKVDFTHLVLIQATSPLLIGEDLEAGIRLYEQGAYDSVLSVVRQKRFNWREDGRGSYLPVNYDVEHRPRRQEFNGYLVENGAFYITSAQAFAKSHCRLSGRIGAYEMAEDTYFEIDEPSDQVVIEHFLKKRLQKEQAIPKRKNTERIRLVLTDCDGVLTDGGMYYSEKGDELKKFNTKDGVGLQLLKEAGIKRGVITGEDTQIIADRAAKLQLDLLYKGIRDKRAVLQKIIEEEGITLSQTAYIGDDINDLECIRAVGLGIAVADAAVEVREAANLVLKTKGGYGAVREAAGCILAYNQKVRGS